MMLSRVPLVTTDISEERGAYIITVERICGLGTALDETSNYERKATLTYFFVTSFGC
jgi:hypothetical protein